MENLLEERAWRMEENRSFNSEPAQSWLCHCPAVTLDTLPRLFKSLFHTCEMGMVIKATPLVLLCGLKTIYEKGQWLLGKEKFFLSSLGREGAPTSSLTDSFSYISATAGCRG